MFLNHRPRGALGRSMAPPIIFSKTGLTNVPQHTHPESLATCVLPAGCIHLCCWFIYQRMIIVCIYNAHLSKHTHIDRKTLYKYIYIYITQIIVRSPRMKRRTLRRVGRQSLITNSIQRRPLKLQQQAD